MNVIIIESYDKNHNAEWGVSFTSSNPESKDCVMCKTKDDAVKLKQIASRIKVVYDG